MVRSKAWIWLFSSTLSTIAFSGGFRCSPGHVDDLGPHLRVGGEPERLRPPRLHAVVTPRLRDGGVADLQVLGQQARGPVRHAQLLRWWGQGRGDDLGVVDHSRPTRPLLVLQTRQTASLVPTAPQQHGRSTDLQPLLDLDVRHPLDRQQHDPSATRQARWGCGGTDDPLKPGSVTITQRQSRRGTIRHASCSHPMKPKGTSHAEH